MKTWKKPELLSLNVQYTNEGGFGGESDGVSFRGPDGAITLGTSGPSIEGPDHVRV